MASLADLRKIIFNMKTLYLPRQGYENLAENASSFWEEVNSPRVNTEYFMTLEQVAKSLNVTRERVRQIEAKALKKLAHQKRAITLKDFLY